MSRFTRFALLSLALALMAGAPALSIEKTAPGASRSDTSAAGSSASSSSGPAHASGGEVRIPEYDEWCRPCPVPPIPVPRPGKETGILALRRTEVRANVLGPVAEVEVIQYYHNPATFPITVGYTFPLPGDAALRGLEVVIDDRRLRGEVRELDEARRMFEDAQQAGHGAVLVEERRSNVFRARLANVLPGQEIAVRLRYVQTLTFASSGLRFTFPTVVAPRYCPASLEDPTLFDLPYVPSGLPGHAIDIRVSINGSPAAIASPSHPISVTTSAGLTEVALGRATETPNRDFILAWKPAGSSADGESRPEAELWIGDRTDAGTPFLLVAWPARRSAAEISGREVVFILDSSGSMSGSKWTTATRAVKGFLRGLGSRDTIRLVEFDDNWTELDNAALPFNQTTLDRADAWIDGLSADGGTEILRPLEAMLRRGRDPERERIVVLLTDGQVGNEAEVLEAVRRHAGGTRIFTLGIDYAVNDAMLKGIARRTQGSCLLLTPDEDVEGAILTLTRRFSSPILTGLKIDGTAPAIEHFPADLPDLFAGEPLVVSGRFRGAAPAHVNLVGKEGRDPWRAELTPHRVAAGGVDLGALAAKAEIQAILDGAERADESATRRRVVPIALANNLSSPWTAFVVIERRTVRADTGLVHEIEVPVAFPQGWNWNAVFGPRGGRGGAPSLARVAGRLFSTVMPTASAPPSPGISGYGVAADGSWKADEVEAAGNSPSVTAEVQARRYLVRHQRADGFWQVSGSNNVRVTALALLGLLAEPASHQAAIDRAATALSSSSLRGEDALTLALVKAALERAARETGESSWAQAASKISGAFALPPDAELSRLGATDDAESLATLALATARTTSGAESGRALASTRLVGRIERAGALAGVVSIDGRPSLTLTALAAALAR